MRRRVMVCACCIAIIAGSLAFLTSLLKPKYMGDIIEGALIAEYYKETTDHDVIFIGDCEVYENFSPITLWEEYGITSYIRGSAQQLIWQSYYLLEETLKYEKPEVVVFNVLSMKYNEPQREAYNRMTLDGMRWSMSKVKDIRASMMEDENFIEYVIPLLRYHSRWNELTEEDWKYLFHRDKVSHNGYYMRVDVKPAGTFPADKKLGNYQFGDNAYEYLDKITTLCKGNDIQLILIKAPSVYPSWYEQWDQQMVEYAEKNQIRYINFLDLQEEMGLDFQTDTYDGGLHLNLAGAEKASKYLGKLLKEDYGLADHREDGKLAEVWKEKQDFYYQMKADQEQDLEQYGYIRKFHEE
ncbi:MAG: SGNH/GDSL hydrolase family protein [Hungatella sp.]|nr:SGNH/GDSL hydrolase family protein [Hungatella sp.]